MLNISSKDISNGNLFVRGIINQKSSYIMMMPGGALKDINECLTEDEIKGIGNQI